MTDNSPTGNRQFRKTRRSSWRWAVIAAFVLLTVLAIRYWPHIFWKIAERRLGPEPVNAVPTTEMPPTAVPADWKTHRIDELEFRLPPDFSLSEKQPNPKLVIFDIVVASLIMPKPSDVSEILAMFQLDKIRPEASRWTLPRLRLEVYRTDSTDFRWSMTSGEVRWHAFCMSAGRLIRLNHVGQIETNFREDIEAVIEYSDSDATIDWQRTGGTTWGYMTFTGDFPVKHPDVVRAVCASLRVVDDDVK